MNAKVERTQVMNTDPLLSVDKNGYVLYSNEAGNHLLNEWCVEIGEKLPSSIGEIVQRVISQNNPEKMEVKVRNKIYLFVFSPLPGQECVIIYGFDISDQKELGEKVQKREVQRMEDVELGELIDAQAIQSLMNDFYMLAQIPMGLDDLRGHVLVGVGWQDICTKFHRINPETCSNCIESSTTLLKDVLHGGFKLYKCKNNMWHVATPIMVGGKHVGNIISGQFFFDDEPLDYEFYRSQARKYDFNEGEYIAALEKVPRLSRKAVETGMSFFIKLANLISQLSYSNNKLVQSLVERDTLLEDLRNSEEKFRQVTENIEEVIFSFTPDWKQTIYVSPAYERIWGRLLKDVYSNSMAWLEGVYPDDRELPLALVNKHIDGNIMGTDTVEFRVLRPDGGLRWILVRTYPVLDEHGNIYRITGIAEDITERKQIDEALKKVHETLEEKVKERTDELERVNISLTESEKGLAEAQEMASIGNWVWDIKIDKAYWSDELYRIFGRSPQESAPTYNEYLNYVHPDDLDYVADAFKKAAIYGKSYSIDHRIILANGQERTIHIKSEIIFDKKNDPVRVKGIVQDITERKKAEQKLRESEEKYRNIVETANEGIVLLDREGIITYLNKKMANMIGYSPEEMIGRYAWDFVASEDVTIAKSNIEKRHLCASENYEIKLIRKDGSAIWVAINAKSLFDEGGKYVGSLSMHTDITKRKEAEENLKNIETVRKQEIHHRIKNNLQVISSLLDLQAEQFKGIENIKESQVLEAFRESQDRVISMALIHEELYRGGGFETLNFSPYIQELAENLFLTYRLGSTDITLSIDLEKNLFFDMDTAVPLGMIVNELVSNSLKHAFTGRDNGEIQIKLQREENEECETRACKRTCFTLIVSDNGIGIPENIDIEEFDSLGLQLVTTLVEQLDAELELKRNNGTEFIIRFSVTGNNDRKLTSGQLEIADNE